jgi:ferredoxin
MPWVDKDKCVGCDVCIEKCPSGAIVKVDNKAEINMQNCIRCGTCHGICPVEAVRHDSEKIPTDVKANIEMTKQFMAACVDFFHDQKEKWKCLERMKKHFNKEKIVAEKTLAELEKIQQDA